MDISYLENLRRVPELTKQETGLAYPDYSGFHIIPKKNAFWGFLTREEHGYTDFLTGNKVLYPDGILAMLFRTRGTIEDSIMNVYSIDAAPSPVNLEQAKEFAEYISVKFDLPSSYNDANWVHIKISCGVAMAGIAAAYYGITNEIVQPSIAAYSAAAGFGMLLGSNFLIPNRWNKHLLSKMPSLEGLSMGVEAEYRIRNEANTIAYHSRMQKRYEETQSPLSKADFKAVMDMDE
jgi:hypothetical protein